MTESRKLAAILAADVVGFSRLTSVDEERTLARLRTLRSDVIDPTIAVHRGRVVKRTGDGALVEFRSVVDAVRCAIEVQNAMVERNAGLPPERRIEFRIGVHLGDVVEESDGDLMGDGVNIAARLEGLAHPGGICLSEDAWRQVRSRLDVAISDLGETRLKNIVDPMRVYALQVGLPAQAAPAAPPSAAAKPAAPADARPTLAVLPIRVISGDDEIQSLAQGLREDIVGSFARQTAIAVLDVPGGGTADAPAAASFRLEGTVRASGKRLRLTFSLVEAEGQSQAWSERYDRELDDIFALEDEISESVASAVRIRIKARAFEKLRSTDNTTLSVPDLLSKAAGYFVNSYAHNDEAAEVLRLAVEKAPGHSMALAMSVFCRWRAFEFSPLDVPDDARQAMMADAARAVSLDGKSFFAQLIAALACQDLGGDYRTAARHADTAVELNPKFSQAQAMVGVTRIHLGDRERGVDILKRAIAAVPEDPHRFRHLRELALAHFIAGAHDEALEVADRLVHLAPELSRNRLVLAAIAWYAGRHAVARECVERLRREHRDLTLRTMRPVRFTDPAVAEHYVLCLSEAGLAS